MGRIFVVTSGKGGTGKTTSAVNLGSALNSFGEDVILVDGNLTTPNVGLHFGAPVVPISLAHVLSGNAKIEDSIYEHESGVKIIPTSLSIKELRKTNKKYLENIAKKLKRLFSYVIFDSAAGLGDEAISIISLADEVILVSNPDMPSITDALKTIKIAEELGKTVRGVIITRVRYDKTELTPENIIDMLEVPILGVIPEEFAVRESLAMKSPVVHTHPKSRSAEKYKEIAAKIIGRDYKAKKHKTGFWSSIKKSLGL
ncbi:MAG: cell division ATPase MinD [Nanoarchaeota archaeon]